MREYLKRAAVMCHQLGKPWLNISHMTGTQVVPFNTWAAMNLSWENKYGPADFQDRFSRDYIRAETLGLQSGCVPIVLGTTGTVGGAAKNRKQWLLRTLLGTILVHEIKDWGHGCGSGLFRDVYRHLFDFGYGTPECALHNYWEKDFPLTIKGVDAEALLLSRNGEAMIVVTNFGDGGDCRLTLDHVKLKLAKTAGFINLESGKKLQLLRKTKYGCVFPLPRHDFRLLYFRNREKK